MDPREKAAGRCSCTNLEVIALFVPVVFAVKEKDRCIRIEVKKN